MDKMSNGFGIALVASVCVTATWYSASATVANDRSAGWQRSAGQSVDPEFTTQDESPSGFDFAQTRRDVLIQSLLAETGLPQDLGVSEWSETWLSAEDLTALPYRWSTAARVGDEVVTPTLSFLAYALINLDDDVLSRRVLPALTSTELESPGYRRGDRAIICRDIALLCRETPVIPLRIMARENISAYDLAITRERVPSRMPDDYDEPLVRQYLRFMDSFYVAACSHVSGQDNPALEYFAAWSMYAGAPSAPSLAHMAIQRGLTGVPRVSALPDEDTEKVANAIPELALTLGYYETLLFAHQKAGEPVDLDLIDALGLMELEADAEPWEFTGSADLWILFTTHYFEDHRGIEELAGQPIALHAVKQDYRYEVLVQILTKSGVAYDPDGQGVSALSFVLESLDDELLSFYALARHASPALDAATVARVAQTPGLDEPRTVEALGLFELAMQADTPSEFLKAAEATLQDDPR